MRLPPVKVFINTVGEIMRACARRGKFLHLVLSCCYAIMFSACQHQRTADDDSAALKTGKAGNCEEPQFEMQYTLSEVMPAYIDLGVEMTREKGPFRASFGNDNNYDTEIRLAKQEEGLVASISVREGSDLKKKTEGVLVNRYGSNDPFMLVIENGANNGDPRAITVKAREMSERKNRGIVKDTSISAIMPAANPQYLQVSSHHRGLIVTEGGQVKERFFMKNGIHRGKTITPKTFQDIAEDYLFCLGTLAPDKGELEQDKGGTEENTQEQKYGK